MGHTTTDLAGEARRAPDPEAARAARAAVYERVIRRIHAYFRRLLRDPGEAEECLSRTLLELERTLAPGAAERGGYDPQRSFNTWMWLKAHTVYAAWCRERARDRGRAEPLGERDPQANPARDDPAAVVDGKLDAATLLGEIERRLGSETLEAFLLFYEGGLSKSEVAETLGRDRATIAKRIEAAHGVLDQLRSG